jgi:serine/threonine protein kinase
VSPAAARLDPGTVLGPYVVERLLSSGEAGSLYLAHDSEGDRVVVRLFAAEGVTPASRARFRRDARALASVDHPGVARLRGVGEHEGAPWIATEHVHGTELRQVLAERGALPLDQALRYAIGTAEALVAAHDAGVIHRELKPQSVIVTPSDAIVLVDFGIAKRRVDMREEDERDRLTLSGDGLRSSFASATTNRDGPASTAYLSPEQIEHGLEDERSDIWALGCVLYEMVVGAPPFGRGGPSTMSAIVRDEPLFPAHFSGAIVHVVTACLRKSSFARIASPRELLPLLRDAREDPLSELAAGPERTSSSLLPRSAARSSLRASVRPSAAAEPSGPGSRTGSMRPSSKFPSTVPPDFDPSSDTRLYAGSGRVKGAALRAGVLWFDEVYGDGALARVVELASPELRAILRPNDAALGLIASGWYESQLVGELLGLLEHTAQPNDPQGFGSRLADAVARDNVGGVYRALFRRIGSPALLEANAQRLWRTYVDEGSLSVQLVGATAFRAYARGWSRHDASVCIFFRALFEGLLRQVGYTDLGVVRAGCVDDGHQRCEFAGTWASDW